MGVGQKLGKTLTLEHASYANLRGLGERGCSSCFMSTWKNGEQTLRISLRNHVSFSKFKPFAS